MPPPPDPRRWIQVRGAALHNLRRIDVDIPHHALTVITGLSGSGKSTLAFDTIYAEGRRRYVESLSIQARQFLEQMAKPEVERIDGLPPTIAIGQHAGALSPRSTVATMTELHDLLRLLFARAGTPHCVSCGRVITRATPTRMTDEVLALPEGTRVMILAPPARGRPVDPDSLFASVVRDGFVRVRVNGTLAEAKSPPPLDPKKPATIEVVVDRIVVRGDIRTRVAESIETALRRSGGWVIVSSEVVRSERGPAATPEELWQDRIYCERFGCPECGISLEELEPRLFSFNSPYGACATCKGLGFVPSFDESRIVPDRSAPLEQAVEPWRLGGRAMAGAARRLIAVFCTHFGVAPATPFKATPARVRRIFLHGTSAADEKHYGHRFEGAIPSLRRRYASTDRDTIRQRLHAYLSEEECPDCHGTRLRPEALAVRVDDRNIDDLSRMTVQQARQWAEELNDAGAARTVIEPIAAELRGRLRFLDDVGVGYLALSRQVDSLSGGELQRVRLATQIGGGLSGVCYVLDEPTVGLHPRDSDRLLDTLQRLQAGGNTLIVVEHDERIIRAADWLIDIGPGAGAQGGAVVYQGEFAGLAACAASATGKWFREPAALDRSALRRRAVSREDRFLKLAGARSHNLKRIDVDIPLGLFCCVTGVSGSGKSSLIADTLLPAIRRHLGGGRVEGTNFDRLEGAEHVTRLVEVDQRSLGRSARSNAATYTGLFDGLRSLFAQTREARIRGYGESRFSFNVRGGRCEACQGHGTRRIEMLFLPDVHAPCPECDGSRYNRETLQVKYRGHSIADVLNLRVDQALALFESIPNLHSILRGLADVGLDYLTLGQPSATLSGGESQRVRLASELHREMEGHTLYVLDEPTTGLHFVDVERLLALLNRFRDAGHTVLVVEHNLDVIRDADWIIDLGPEGGDAGGRLVAAGSPERIAAAAESHTGEALRAAGV